MSHKTSRVGFLIRVLVTLAAASPPVAAADLSGEATFRALAGIRNLTLIQTELGPEKEGTPQYCYARGIISPAIHHHVQLPLPESWNGRLLNIGDGAKDGDLDFAGHRLAQMAPARLVTTTFRGDVHAAREKICLFMVPGMDHCRGGPGPNTWDKLAPLVDWVENGQAPDYLVATHSTDGMVDNERPICPYPQRAVYTGPAGGENDRHHWVRENFTCR